MQFEAILGKKFERYRLTLHLHEYVEHSDALLPSQLHGRLRLGGLWFHDSPGKYTKGI
jgi:hypothetical protein